MATALEGDEKSGLCRLFRFKRASRASRVTMDARTGLKSRLPNRQVTERAPRRSYLCARTASAGSTDAALHLRAIADQCCIKFDLFDAAEIFKKTPCIADLKPRGRYVAKDMFEVGGIPVLMKTLLDHGYIHGDCPTVTGRTIAVNLKNVKWNPHQDAVRSADKPITVTGGVAGPKGNLAPEGAVVKVAGMSRLKSTGPVRRFDYEAAAFESVQREICKEAVGGPIALLRDGDIVEVDAQVGSLEAGSLEAGSLDVKLTGAEGAERKTKWMPRETNHTSGVLWKYARQVGPAIDGAVTHPGGAHEKQCYADI
jgi:dihydroxy-acid dehydratase